MKSRVSKTRIRRSLDLPKTAQIKLLDVATERSIDSGISSKTKVAAQLPDGPQDLPLRKRKLDTTSQIDKLPKKRVRTAGQTLNSDSQGFRRSARLQERQNSPNIEPPTVLIPQKLYTQKLEAGLRSTTEKSKRYDLTSRNLRTFDRKNQRLLGNMGKEKSSKKKGVSSLSSSRTRTTTEQSSSDHSRTISTTTSGFAKLALENGVLDRINSTAPTNINDRLAILNKERDSAPPSQSMYEDFVTAVDTAPNEQTLVMEMARLLKKPDDKGYRSMYDQAFTGFPKDVGFNNGLSAPQPDFVEGLQRQQFKPLPVEERIKGAVLLKNNPYSITLPHIAGEWKAPGKDMIEARTQSAYDGAALVYGRNQAMDFLGKPDPPGHAAVTSFTTDGTNINFFAHHSAQSQEDGRVKYHQYPITSTNLMNSFPDFKKGRKQLRNAQDHARTESYKLKNQLNEFWNEKPNEDSARSFNSPPGNGVGGPSCSTGLRGMEDNVCGIVGGAPYGLVPLQSSIQQDHQQITEQCWTPSSTSNLMLNHLPVDFSGSITPRKHNYSSSGSGKGKGKKTYGKRSLP